MNEAEQVDSSTPTTAPEEHAQGMENPLDPGCSSAQNDLDQKPAARGLSKTRISIGVLLFVATVLLIAKRVPQDSWVPPPTPAETASLHSREPVERAKSYAWLTQRERRAYQPLVERIPAPAGFGRVKAPIGGFADWLRHLPTAPEGTAVKTGRGQVGLAGDDPRLAAVIVLQPHNDKLLLAPNILTRLRGEYRWSAALLDDLGFHFTSGHLHTWSAWSGGQRPTVHGKDVEFRQEAKPDSSRESFCAYLETLFRYGTVYSLWQDTHEVLDQSIQAGDVFIRLGRPGHAAIVLDVATSEAGEVRVLMGQGGTPAQTFHVPRSKEGSPWFPLSTSRQIDVGGGAFSVKDLRRWGE